MRHSKKVNHLGRQSAHRKALLSNMANSLILHKRITTTLAKAKALRTYVEPLITKAKSDSTHSRRVIFSYLKSKTAVAVLFRDVIEKVGERPGGYTRILKTGTRLGDNSEMCIIELVDFNENMLAAKVDKAKEKKSSRRGGAKKKADEKKTEAPVAKAKKEAPITEPVPAEQPQEIIEEPVEEVKAEEVADAEETNEEEKAE